MFFTKPDLVLLHPPSICDFRKMLTIPGPISDLVPSGPLRDVFIGFTFIGEYLERNGINVRVVNLCQPHVGKGQFRRGEIYRQARTARLRHRLPLAAPLPRGY